MRYSHRPVPEAFECIYTHTTIFLVAATYSPQTFPDRSKKKACVFSVERERERVGVSECTNPLFFKMLHSQSKE